MFCLSLFQLKYERSQILHITSLFLYNIQKDITLVSMDRNSFRKISLALMTIGYLWLWCFNRNPHVLVKFLTTQSYFLVWLYFFILVLNKKAIFGYNMDRLFEINFVLQFFIVTPAYWLMIHGPMVDSKKFPFYQVLWNVYVHLAPVILMIAQLFIGKNKFSQGNWKDTAYFYFLFSWPVNLLYTHFHYPVYKFILYDDVDDYIFMLSIGLLSVFFHWGSYKIFKLWKGNSQESLGKKAA